MILSRSHQGGYRNQIIFTVVYDDLKEPDCVAAAPATPPQTNALRHLQSSASDRRSSSRLVNRHTPAPSRKVRTHKQRLRMAYITIRSRSICFRRLRTKSFGMIARAGSRCSGHRWPTALSSSALRLTGCRRQHGGHSLLFKLWLFDSQRNSGEPSARSQLC